MMIVKIRLKKTKQNKTNLLEPISKTLNAPPLVQIIVYPTDTKVIVEYSEMKLEKQSWIYFRLSMEIPH